MAHDKIDQGIAGMLAGFMLARGGGVGLIAGVILYFIIADHDKIKADFAANKEEARVADEAARTIMEEYAQRRARFKAAGGSGS